eukprot:g33531.t1
MRRWLSRPAASSWCPGAPKDSASSQRCGLPARCKALLAAFTVLALSSLAIFEIRVNVLLILYMPLVSGQFFEFEWLLPWLDSYLDLEIWWNPENFQAYDLQEIAAEDFTNTSAAPASFAPESGSKHMQIFSSTRSLPKRSTREYRYAAGLDELITRYPEIPSAMGLEKLGGAPSCRTLAMFINGKGEGLQWHNANHFNIVMEYHGTKVWQLLDPKYTLFVAPEYSWDPYATGFVAKSDVLLNPVWSWHRVRNDADRATGLVAMGSCRFSESVKALGVPALEFHRSFGQVMWVNPKLPSWVRWVPFFRVVQDGLSLAFDWTLAKH